MYKTTTKHFEKFKTCCLKWVDKFGMGDWEIYFKFSDKDDSVLSTCSSDNINRIGVFTLYQNWGDHNPTNQNLEYVAVHEVLHLVLSRFQILAGQRYIRSEEEIDEEIHAIIARLIRALGLTHACTIKDMENE